VRATTKKDRRHVLSLVRPHRDGLLRLIADQHRAAGIEGFREAVHEGVLEIHGFRRIPIEALVESQFRGGVDWLNDVDKADVLIEFYEQGSSTVRDGTTYPLLDAPTAGFVAAAEGLGFTEGLTL
jgi:hypothetical protein